MTNITRVNSRYVLLCSISCTFVDVPRVYFRQFRLVDNNVSFDIVIIVRMIIRMARARLDKPNDVCLPRTTPYVVRPYVFLYNIYYTGKIIYHEAFELLFAVFRAGKYNVYGFRRNVNSFSYTHSYVEQHAGRVGKTFFDNCRQSEKNPVPTS